jgi:pimeloyl-ACP methyl ester carboxylesterase
LNFIVADYRGYGISTGNPTVSSMLSDAYIIFDHICSILDDKGYTGPVWIMGRSLGSAPAIEIAANRQERVAGLIVESGFAGVEDLLRRLGIFSESLGIDPTCFFQMRTT